MPVTQLARVLPLLIIATVANSGCLFFPCPHSATRNSHLTGRVVDDETGSPLAGVVVELSESTSYYGDVSMLTDEDGRFDLPPKQARAYIKIVPLLPFDYFPTCSETLRLHLPQEEAAPPEAPAYREQTLEVHSCPPTPVPGSPDPSNEDIRDDLGEIRLKRRPW